jgi:hypothetical protein
VAKISSDNNSMCAQGGEGFVGEPGTTARDVVWSVTCARVEALPSETGFGEDVHVVAAGSPAQEIIIPAEDGEDGVTGMENIVNCPAGIVALGGEGVPNEKSTGDVLPLFTVWVNVEDVLPLKFVSPL